MIRPSRYDRDSHQQKTQLKGKTLTMFQKIFTPHENIIFFHTEAIQNHIQRKSRMYFGTDDVRKVILTTVSENGYGPLTNKPYVNEVTLTDQNLY